MQYSVFGSILTIGAMIGAIMSGRVADIIGRKYVRIMAFVFQVNWGHYPCILSQPSATEPTILVTLLAFGYRQWRYQISCVSWDGLP